MKDHRSLAGGCLRQSVAWLAAGWLAIFWAGYLPAQDDEEPAPPKQVVPATPPQIQAVLAALDDPLPKVRLEAFV